jgi:DNA-binding transcriptional ArsR family regulator
MSMSRKKTPPSVYRVTQIEQVKALADPLRQRILGWLAKQARTTKQVAQLLGENPTKLYHHVDLLERAGLIHLVETRPNRGTVEKYYRAAAGRFAIARSVFSHMPSAAEDPIESMFRTVFDATLDEIRESVAEKLIDPKSKQPPAVLVRGQIQPTPTQLKDLQARIQNWIDSVEANCAPAAPTFGLTLALYPVKPKRRSKK